MKKLWLLCCLSIHMITLAQTTYTYTGIGNWADEANWSPSYPGTFIRTDDAVIIATNAEVSAPVFTLIRVDGSMTINGTLTTVSKFTVNGIVTNNNTFDPGSLENNNVLINKGTINAGSTTNEGNIINSGVWNQNGTWRNNRDVNSENGTMNFEPVLFYGNNTTHSGDVVLSSRLIPQAGPGTEIGTYNFNDNLTFTDTAKYDVQLKSTSEFDTVNIDGNAVLDGNLNIRLLDDFDPPVGSKYTILTAGNISGTLNRDAFARLSEGKFFEINYTATSIEVVVKINYTYSGTGAWTDEANWSPSYPGITTSEFENITLDRGSNVTFIESLTLGGEVIVYDTFEEGSGAPTNAKLTINGTLENFGTITTRSIEFINNGTFENRDTAFLSDFANYGTTENRGNWSGLFFRDFGTLIEASTNVFRGNFNVNNLYGTNVSHQNDFGLEETLDPGNGFEQTGIYTFDKDFSMASIFARYHVDIIGDSDNDLVVVNGNANLNGGGGLRIRVGNDYDPPVGTTFTILTANSITGTFEIDGNPASGDLDPSKEFQINYEANRVMLEVVEKQTLSITGITEKDTKIAVYPNPASDDITISNIIDSQTVSIYSYSGKLIKEYMIDAFNNTISIEDLAMGGYFISTKNQYFQLFKN